MRSCDFWLSTADVKSCQILPWGCRSNVAPTVIFLVDKVGHEFERVYTPELRRELASFSGMHDVPIVERESLMTLSGRLATVETIFSTWNMPVFSSSEIGALFPRLKSVFYAAGSTKYFAGPYLDRGVKVFSAAALNARPVAEFAFAQIALASKGYFRTRVLPSWNPLGPRQRARAYPGNSSVKIGILGAGQIGRSVVRMLRDNLDCEIWIYDPYISESDCQALGARKASLEQVFQGCDVISNHMPDLEETQSVLDRSLFKLMRSTATFINTGRGRQVVERHLAATLRRNPLQTALLDVTISGVVRPWNPLLWRRNAHITPHIAGSTGNEMGRLGRSMVENHMSISRGLPPEYEVSAEDLERGA